MISRLPLHVMQTMLPAVENADVQMEQHVIHPLQPRLVTCCKKQVAQPAVSLGTVVLNVFTGIVEPTETRNDSFGAEGYP